MELQLGLALPTSNDRLLLPHWLHSSEGGRGHHYLPMAENKKRGFEEAFCDHEEDDRSPRTLTLFHWDNQQPDEDDSRSVNSEMDTTFASNKLEGLIGWPPIKNHRRKLVNYNQYHRIHNGPAASGDHSPGGRRRRRLIAGLGNSNRNYNSKFVKVKMEGVGIARKIDLTLFLSVATLKQALFAMFDICQENFGCYELTYQDTEGDWRLAEEDVSWGNFIILAQRLELVKSSNV